MGLNLPLFQWRPSGGEEQNSISGGSQFPVWYSLRQEILKFVVDKYWNGWYDNQVVWETDIGKQLRAFFIYDFGKNKNEKSSWQVWKDLINCQSCLKTRQQKQKFSNKKVVDKVLKQWYDIKVAAEKQKQQQEPW